MCEWIVVVFFCSTLCISSLFDILHDSLLDFACYIHYYSCVHFNWENFENKNCRCHCHAPHGSLKSTKYYEWMSISFFFCSLLLCLSVGDLILMMSKKKRIAILCGSDVHWVRSLITRKTAKLTIWRERLNWAMRHLKVRLEFSIISWRVLLN